jgi:hypothetical protein
MTEPRAEGEAAVSEHPSNAAFDVALVRLTTAPALNPAAPAMSCACARAWVARSANLQAGACWNGEARA